MEEIISFKNIDKTFFSQKDKFFALRKKKINVFKNLNISFKRGEIVALLGPNGAGKTTMFRMISTLVLPNRGRLTVGGHNPVNDPIPVRKLVSFINSEEGSFYYRLTGRQNLRFFATLCNIKKREMRKRVKLLEPIFKLEEHMDKRYQEYSTGLKQKLNLARGLSRNSSIILLDEPVKSIDTQTSAKVMDYIKNTVRANGKTAILTTHNMNEVQDFADRFVIVDRGTVVADFDKSKLRNTSLEVLYKTYVR